MAYVREFLENNSPHGFPLLLKRVVYSGTHSGDWVAASDAPQLLTETRSEEFQISLEVELTILKSLLQRIDKLAAKDFTQYPFGKEVVVA